MLRQTDGEAAQPVYGIEEPVKISDEHDDVAGRQLALHHHPAAVAEHQGLAQSG